MCHGVIPQTDSSETRIPTHHKHLSIESEIESMADVQPLRGIRYRSETVGDLAEVVTPPYDVISQEAQARYYTRNSYNFIRLEFGQEQATDTTLNNRYTRAATTFAEWRLKGVLQQAASPCYYLYQQLFSYNGQNYTRTSLLARVRLEPWSAKVVLPHEYTMTKPKDDRLHLLQACAANFSPLMSMYEDPQGRMRRLLSAYAANAEVQMRDEMNEEHRLQPITDPQQTALIQDFFTERQLYIADGHHRYETALNYREEIRQQRHIDDNDAVNYVLMSLIDVDDPGLLVLPTHRLLSRLSVAALSSLSSQQMEQYFIVRQLDPTATSDAMLAELARVGAEQPSLVVCNREHNWLLSPNEQGKRRMRESGHSAAWNELDVAVAHTLLLETLLGIKAEEVTSGTYIKYTRDAEQAREAVQKGEAQVALLLNATKVRQICEVAQADDRMPQKSTYFYPKLISGLVMNPLW
ncbi:MAG TPA: DUF1015 domain-containing protein [Ktedonobacter sp.]|jgi:uncharacterized protein (DUF1015 family)|nr:DUF1015 domain-containing protein [Ktedonobacter sp.]